ncbi:50S ribosomal protein L25 [Candidatus Uhrbacteria bacterium]|nr:50S ribosomal protein L25 [Candidatus Uhrbacteria bacterium]
MATYSLNAEKRTVTGKSVQALREQRFIPGILYGNGIEPLMLTVQKSEFDKVYREAGASQLVNVTIEGSEPIAVLIHDVQRDPRLNTAFHIDFYRVNLKEKLTAEIQLRLIGESKAVKALGGILVKGIDHVEVRCLPTDLVPEIAVDISVIKDFEHSIRIKDIIAPLGIDILNDENVIVVSVMAPLSEEELKISLEGKTDTDIESIKVEERGKKEEAEPNSAPKTQ